MVGPALLAAGDAASSPPQPAGLGQSGPLPLDLFGADDTEWEDQPMDPLQWGSGYDISPAQAAMQGEGASDEAARAAGSTLSATTRSWSEAKDAGNSDAYLKIWTTLLQVGKLLRDAVQCS